jgi:hypothetical protein
MPQPVTLKEKVILLKANLLEISRNLKHYLKVYPNLDPDFPPSPDVEVILGVIDFIDEIMNHPTQEDVATIMNYANNIIRKKDLY